MNNIENVFKKGKAIIPFIVAGHPSLELTEKLIYALARSGADMIELGMPFSDPVADGPVIQRVYSKVLESGITTDDIFDMLQRTREKIEIPLIIMSYLNPIFVYGVDKFINRCVECGVKGLIIPDIPYEEREELEPFCIENGIDVISLVTPTSKERIALIVKNAKSFIYCVSSPGVTDIPNEFHREINEMITLVRKFNTLPCVADLGISTPEQAKDISQFADGIIIGSAIVSLVADKGDQCIPAVEAHITSIKDALHGCLAPEKGELLLDKQAPNKPIKTK